MKNKIEEFIGKVVTVKLGGLVVDVEVIDVKNSYGRDRYLITPVKGEGEVWVEKQKINLEEEFLPEYPDTIKGSDFPNSYPNTVGSLLTKKNNKK